MFVNEKEGCSPMPKDIRVSWTSLKRYQRCHHAMKLVMDGKRNKTQNGRVFLKGNLCDHSMRKWLEAEDFTVPIEHYLKDVWIEETGPNAPRPIKWKGPSDQEEVVEEARLALAALEEDLREHVIPYEYEPEWRFTTRVGVPSPDGKTIYLQIFTAIDIAVRYPDGGIGIWDLKLSKDRSYIKSSIGQLVFYDLGVRNYLGVKPTTWGFYTPMLAPKETRIELEVTDEDRRSLVSDVVSFAHGQWRGDWGLTEDENNCFGCDVRHACIRWQKPIPKDLMKKNRERFGKR